MEKFKTLTKLIKSFEEGTENVERISKQVILKGCKELQLYFVKLESDPVVLLDLLNSLKYLVKHNGNCFLHLKEQGIVQMMKEIFQQVISKIPSDGSSDTLLNIIELCTETANVLADVNSDAKSCVALELCPLFLDILLQPLSFQTRLEVLKSNNQLLEQCPTKVKEEILNDERNTERIFALVKAVKDAGDYEFQVGVIECLMRIFPRKSRQQYASRFIQDTEMMEGFMGIKDKDFETDCRLYLNNVNAKSEDPTQGVFSLPCVSAFMGNKELRKPSDPGYEEFWVDFNIGSERITLFCEQSSLNSQSSVDDMWETVAIYKTDVQKYTCNAVDGLMVLEISLKGAVCEIYPSQHQTVTANKIWVKFDPSLEPHLTHAVSYTYNFAKKRQKASEVVQPLKISLKEVEQADSQSQQEHYNSRPPDYIADSQECKTKRCRASVPSIPMTPDTICSRNSDEEKSQETVSKHKQASNDKIEQNARLAKVTSGITQHLAGEKDKVKQKSKTKVQEFAAPRTPKMKTKTKQKVKTPVVTVTPPPKKVKNCKKNISKAIDNKELPESNLVQESFENEDSFEVIPDSLPQEDHVQDTGASRNKKASVPNKDDSGVDCSLSTTLNSSKNTTLQNEDEKEDSPEQSKKLCKDKKPGPKKNISKTKKNSQNTMGDNKLDSIAEHRKDSTVDTHENVPTANKHEEVSTVECKKQPVEKLENQRSEEVTSDKLSCEKIPKCSDVPAASFGFDSLCIEENMDCIPDSCENQQDTTDVSFNQESDRSSDKIPVAKEKKKKKTKGKSQKAVDIKQEAETEKVEGEINEKNRSKTFTDVDSSLKELADLDTESKTQDVNPNIGSKNNRNNSNPGSKNQKTKKYNKHVDDDQEAVYHNEKIDGNCKNVSVSEKKKSKSSKESTIGKKGRKSDNQADAADDQSNRTRPLRSRRGKGKVNYKEADSSFIAESVSEETSKPSIDNLNDLESDESFNTPKDTPEKNIINEVKVKSSLKKNKKKSDLDGPDPEKRKARVSFDLPSSQSPANAVEIVQEEDKELPRNNMSSDTTCDTLDLDDSVQIVSDSGCSDANSFSNDESIYDTTSKKENSEKMSNVTDAKNKTYRRKQMVEKLSNKTDAKKKTDRKVKDKIQNSDNLTCDFDNIEKMSSLNESTDSLYIESDDSYNARRYKMEVKDKMKKKRRSSTITTKKDRKKFTATKADFTVNPTNALLTQVAESVVKLDHSDQSSESENEGAAFNFDKNGTYMDKNISKSNDKKQNKSGNKKNKNESKSVVQSISTPTIKAKKTKQKMKEESDEDNTNAVEDFVSDSELYPTKEVGSRQKKETRNRKENKNVSYTFNESFEETGGDKSFTVQQQRMQGMVKSGRKQIVFERSYLKSKTNMKSRNDLNKLHRANETNVKQDKSYDPYDFTAQCDNSSMASERIGRKDIIKELKKKQTKNISTNLVQDKKTKNWHKMAAVSVELKNIENPQKNKSKKNLPPVIVEEDSGSNEMSNEDIHEDEPVQVGTCLVQDKKTKKWHRRATVSENVTKPKKYKDQENDLPKEETSVHKWGLPNESDPDMNAECGIDDNMDMAETEIPNFNKIIQEMTLNRMKMKESLEALSDYDDDAPLNDSHVVVMTPCIINSISSTPKVGSARRKHYYPLNISVIKTPQSCQIVDSDTDSDSGERARKKSKKKKASKRSTSSDRREILDSDSERVAKRSDRSISNRSERSVSNRSDRSVSNRSERSVSSRNERRKSRTSTDSISFLDSSHDKSEKSWILERKKSPKHKQKCKAYKYKPTKYNKSENSQTEDSQEEEDALENDKYLQSPIAISSIICTTPALTPSCKSVGSSFHTMDSNICSPYSPIKNTGKTSQKEDYDIEVEQTQENYCISLNMESDDREAMQDFGNMSYPKFSVKTPQKEESDAEESDDGGISMLKLLQQNMTMHGDSGFASGPSSEVRPSRSTLKRKFPNIEEDENMMSSASSQAESIEEEKSTFIPKKLFKFDPQITAVTPQTLSVCSSWNDDCGSNLGYQTGISTSMAAFGADIQKQLQMKKQKIESLTKKSLKETQKCLTQTLVEQQQYQANLTDNLQAKMMTELKAIENDIKILCEAEQKAEDFFKYQIGVLRNNEDSQKQRLKNMKEMQTTYSDKRKRVKKNNYNAYNGVKEHMKAQMNNLQRKLVTEIQKQEYMNMRKRLQSIF